MDINDLRGLSTVFLMISFIGLCLWAYSRKRKKSFDEAANLPFAERDKELNRRTVEKEEQND
ncbi:MAG: cbb3-type cytochrome c oxidase subunit 3 [Halioglobus sp.]|nr:cbb3-type cytochrome c oxidase subunit 3 [Halioglobus sp.]